MDNICSFGIIGGDKRQLYCGRSAVDDGYGVYVAEDCGGAIKGNRIDMYFESHQAACQFGVHRLYVTILE